MLKPGLVACALLIPVSISLPLVGIVKEESPEPWEDDYPSPIPDPRLDDQQWWYYEGSFNPKEGEATLIELDYAKEPTYYSYFYSTSPSPRPVWFPDDEPRPSPETTMEFVWFQYGYDDDADIASMKAVDDWTPRMKREYLLEQKHASPNPNYERDVDDDWEADITLYSNVYETNKLPTPFSEDGDLSFGS